MRYPHLGLCFPFFIYFKASSEGFLAHQADFAFRATISTDMSAGLTPDIREAWPSVAGRNLLNLRRASCLKPEASSYGNLSGIRFPSSRPDRRGICLVGAPGDMALNPRRGIPMVWIPCFWYSLSRGQFASVTGCANTAVR